MAIISNEGYGTSRAYYYLSLRRMTVETTLCCPIPSSFAVVHIHSKVKFEYIVL